MASHHKDLIENAMSLRFCYTKGMSLKVDRDEEGDLLRAEASELRCSEAKQQALSDEQAEPWRPIFKSLKMLLSCF